MDTTSLKNSVALIDPTWTLKGPDDNMYFQHDQDVNDGFIDNLKDIRTQSPHTRSKDFELAADIPVAVVENWLREGFDIHKENWKSIRSRLVREDLGAFIATSKRL